MQSLEQKGKGKTIKPYDIVEGINKDHEAKLLFRNVEIWVFDPTLKVQRIDWIGRHQETLWESKTNKIV